MSLPSSSFSLFFLVPHDLTKLHPLMHRASHGFPHHASVLKKKSAVMYTYYIYAKPAVRNCYISLASTTYWKCSTSLCHGCCACFSSPSPPYPLLSYTVHWGSALGYMGLHCCWVWKVGFSKSRLLGTWPYSVSGTIYKWIVHIKQMSCFSGVIYEGQVIFTWHNARGDL